MKAGAAARAAAAVAVATSAAASAWYAGAAAVPPSFDEAWYLEVSFRLWHALTRHGPLAFAAVYASAFRFKAPLLSVLALPSYALFGLSYRAAVLANVPALAILGVSLYGLGKRFYSPAAGALAVALGLLMPLTAALSRAFFVETWLTALVAAFLWRWVESEALAQPAKAPTLGALLGLGLLTKVLFPLPLLGPVSWTLWERPPEWRAVERPLKVMSVVGAALALTWYAPNLLYVAGYMFRASVGDIAVHYGSTRVWAPSVVLPYWNSLARDGVSYGVILPLAAALLLLGRRAARDPGLRFCAAWALPPLLVTTCGVGKDLRFMAPALPAFALALAGALDLALRGARLRLWVMTAALLMPADLFAWQTFGRAGASPRLPGALAPRRTAYGGPPRQAGRWGQEELVRALAARLPPGSVVAIGCEHPFLNANLLSAWAAREDLPIEFIHYGHMEERVERAVARLSEKDATHILFVDGLDPRELPPMVPAMDAGLRALARAGRLPFQDVGPVPLGGGLRAELWERTAPIRMVGIIGRSP